MLLFMNKIAILLSTYNSSKYIKEQIDSIIKQTNTEWFLYIRDDCSTDNTVEIIKDYSFRYSNIYLFNTVKENIGPCKSFLWLLEKVESEYYMFCDHDDIWIQNKIEISFKIMKELEEKYSKQRPILVHSDMKVVDSSLNLIADSFWKYTGLHHTWSSFNNFSGGNCVNGCTMIINEQAKKVSLINSIYATIHDVWVSLRVSYSNGIIYYISEPTVLYRQHCNNVVGAQKFNGFKSLRKINNLKQVVESNKKYYIMLNHAGQISYFVFWLYKIKSIINNFLNLK